jgi:hypothetical protein
MSPDICAIGRAGSKTTMIIATTNAAAAKRNPVEMKAARLTAEPPDLECLTNLL